MGQIDVNEILVTPLTRVPVVGGDVLHAMKSVDPGFQGFGEAYFSMVEGNAVKAWKRHISMTLNLIVPSGSVLFVFMDEKKQVREELVGDGSYNRITVPPGIWFGFMGLEAKGSLLLNIANIIHDPDEIERKDIADLEYEWKLKR